MTGTASQSAPKQGIISRALAAVCAFLRAMDSSSFDYTLDRIERLEREVGRLKEEMRQGGNTGTADPRNSRAAALEQ